MTSQLRTVRDLSDRVDELLQLYATAWWARSRSRKDVVTMLSRTPVTLGLIDAATDELVAFGRALTDGVFIATILDVIVREDRRTEGLGARLLDEILAVPDVANAASIELVCQPELFAFYRRWGFSEDVGRSTLMRRSGGAGPRS